MGYTFDNDKQKRTAQKFLARLSKGEMNTAQALTFLDNNADYKDNRSHQSFLKNVISSENFPVIRKGDKIRRKDISYEA